MNFTPGLNLHQIKKHCLAWPLMGSFESRSTREVFEWTLLPIQVGILFLRPVYKAQTRSLMTRATTDARWSSLFLRISWQRNWETDIWFYFTFANWFHKNNLCAYVWFERGINWNRVGMTTNVWLVGKVPNARWLLRHENVCAMPRAFENSVALFRVKLLSIHWLHSLVDKTGHRFRRSAMSVCSTRAPNHVTGLLVVTYSIYDGFAKHALLWARIRDAFINGLLTREIHGGLRKSGTRFNKGARTSPSWPRKIQSLWLWESFSFNYIRR